MGTLDGRVAVITGAGRGLGRAHALLMAREGAKVVVNDLGGAPQGGGSDTRPAQEVADLVRSLGGAAVANFDDIADTAGAGRLVQQAIDEFGGLHVLVNNAGILRDRMIFNMAEEEWDDIMRVHLRGHYAPTRAAAAYWREQSKAGTPVKASLINTSSTSGLFANPGQSNYGAAKSGIATFTLIVAKELAQYGVRANVICPSGRTRLTAALRGETVTEEGPFPTPDDPFDPQSPANVSPLVAYLAEEDCPVSGKVFFVGGDTVHLFQPWHIVDQVSAGDRLWSQDQIREAVGKWADLEFEDGRPY